MAAVRLILAFALHVIVHTLVLAAANYGPRDVNVLAEEVRERDRWCGIADSDLAAVGWVRSESYEQIHAG